MTDILKSIRKFPAGLTLAELLARHPDIARRTAQRWVSRLIGEGKIIGRGEGRARRYFAAPPVAGSALAGADIFPIHILLSADSRDILAYVDQPLEARKPVGYQREFLEAYHPNKTWYLPEPLRCQLRKMG